MPDSNKATGRVHIPSTIHKPPKNSSMPATHIRSGNEADAPVPPIPPNQPKSFCAPCGMKRKPAMVRSNVSVSAVYLLIVCSIMVCPQENVEKRACSALHQDRRK